MKLPFFRMGLTRINKGVYSMDGKPIQTEENPVVAVHPFYRKFHYSNPQDEYLQRLNEFISSRQGPIVTFEEHSRINRTHEHYSHLGVKKNRLFIRTKPSTPDPIDITWGRVVNYLDRLRGGRPIEIMGGFFYRRGDPFQEWTGCLGCVARKLKERDIPLVFLDDLIFS